MVNFGNANAGACIYYKNVLHMTVLDIQYLCMNPLKLNWKLEIRLAISLFSIVCQVIWKMNLKCFRRRLDNLMKKKPFLVALIGYFNVSRNQKSIIEKYSFEENIIEYITSHFGLQ